VCSESRVNPVNRWWPGHAIRLWSLGRHPWIALAALLAALVVCGRWWYVVMPTRLLGQFEPRWIQVIEVGPVAAGIIVMVALAPRNPRVDALGRRRRRAVSAAAALVGAAAATSMPIATVYGLSTLPSDWVPAHEQYVPPGQHFIDVVDFHSVIVIMFTIVFVVGLAAGLVALLGVIWGAGGAIASYPTLIFVQSTDFGQAMTAIPVSLWGALSTLVALAGLTMWYRTGAGEPVLARLV